MWRPIKQGYFWAVYLRVYVYNRERERSQLGYRFFSLTPYSKNGVRIGHSHAEISVSWKRWRGTWKSDSLSKCWEWASHQDWCHQAQPVPKHFVSQGTLDMQCRGMMVNNTGQILVSFTQTLITHSQVANMRMCWRLWPLPKQHRKPLRKLFQSANLSRLQLKPRKVLWLT